MWQGSRGVYDPETLLAEAAAAVQTDTEADVLTEAAELLVAEQARVRIEDRWRPGARVQVSLVPQGSIQGQVIAAGPELAVLLGADGSQHAVAVASIARISGLGPALRAEEASGMRVRPSWGAWLRRCEVVCVTCRDGWQQVLQVVSVGADHLDGRSLDGSLECLAFSALVQASVPGSRQWTAPP